MQKAVWQKAVGAEFRGGRDRTRTCDPLGVIQVVATSSFGQKAQETPLFFPIYSAKNRFSSPRICARAFAGIRGSAGWKSGTYRMGANGSRRAQGVGDALVARR